MGGPPGFVTPSTSDPARSATCAIWFVLFDSSTAGPRATKRQFGADQLGAGPDTYIRIADATLTDGRATGRVATDVLEAKLGPHIRRFT